MRKKLKQIERQNSGLTAIESEPKNPDEVMQAASSAANNREEGTSRDNEDPKSSQLMIWDEHFDRPSEGPLNLEWMSKFLEMDESWFYFA